MEKALEKKCKNFAKRLNSLEKDLLNEIKAQLLRIGRNVSVDTDNLQLGTYPDNGFYENIDYFTPDADIVYNCTTTEDISGWLTGGGGMAELLALLNDLSEIGKTKNDIDSIEAEISNLKNERWQGEKTAEEMKVLDDKIELLEELINLPTIKLAFYPISESWDNIEIHPMQTVANTGTEQCNENEADHYSVFVHVRSGGLECIADLPTKELAYSFKDNLLRFLATSKQR